MSPPTRQSRPARNGAAEVSSVGGGQGDNTAGTARRVQQRRTKGWRKPRAARSVVRGTRWGNPYRVDEYGRDEAIRRFEADLTNADRHEIRLDLAGADLMCWCPLDQPCHADVLLRIANGGDAA